MRSCAPIARRRIGGRRARSSALGCGDGCRGARGSSLWPAIRMLLRWWRDRRPVVEPPVWCGRRVLRCGVLRVRWCRRRCGMSVSVAGVGGAPIQVFRWWMWLRGRGRDPAKGPEQHRLGHQFRRGWSVASVDDWDGLPPIAERLNDLSICSPVGCGRPPRPLESRACPTMSPPFVPSITG